MKNGKKTAGVLWFFSLVVIGGLTIASCPNEPSSGGSTPIGENPNPMRLWYDYPAETWMTQALPIGNGELGAMFFGGKQRERIQFNEKTLWMGSSTQMQQGYQNFGDLYIDIASHETTGVTDYRRQLSISDALGLVSYTADGVSYKREYFSSFPDKVIVMRFTTPGNYGSLTLTADLVNAHTGSGTTKNASENAIVFSGKLTTVSYAARLVVLNEGGTVDVVDGQKLKVERADAVTFLLAAITDYDITSASFTSGLSQADLRSSLEDITEQAAQKTYAELKEAHLADYRPLFDRVALNLNQDEPALPTNQVVQTPSNYLAMLYFQFGRYLMLGSSRGMPVPNNLQGIWNDSNNPPWASDLHPNINLQMNYWPAEVTNLSECHMPLLNFIGTLAVKPNSYWRAKAANLVESAQYGGDGSTSHHRGWTVQTESNIFGYTAAWPNYSHNAWLCMHLWQHYAYTLDQNFLRDTAWPAMKSACEFWFDRLIPARNNRVAPATGDGTLEAPIGWSPEQGEGNWPQSFQDGVPYDQQLIYDLFNNTLKALDVLGGEAEFRTELEDKFARLDKGLHTEYPEKPNLLAEYKYPGARHENQHRHISHLVGLFPGSQITPDKTPYYELARASANDRGDEGTGWSRAWKISFWARLRDGNRARTLLSSALQYSSGPGSGIYENLLCSHSPFQIDGNFGATAGVAEMLIQSHRGFIEVLPALPTAWASGSFKGLKAQGNFTVDLEWAGSMPTRCTVYSGSGGKLLIRFGDTVREVQTSRGGKYTVSF